MASPSINISLQFSKIKRHMSWHMSAIYNSKQSLCLSHFTYLFHRQLQCRSTCYLRNKYSLGILIISLPKLFNQCLFRKNRQVYLLTNIFRIILPAIIIPGTIQCPIFKVSSKYFIAGIELQTLCNNVDGISWIIHINKVVCITINERRQSLPALLQIPCAIKSNELHRL